MPAKLTRKISSWLGTCLQSRGFIPRDGEGEVRRKRSGSQNDDDEQDQGQRIVPSLSTALPTYYLMHIKFYRADRMTLQ
jgi:hypothetical protein